MSNMTNTLFFDTTATSCQTWGRPARQLQASPKHECNLESHLMADPKRECYGEGPSNTRSQPAGPMTDLTYTRAPC